MYCLYFHFFYPNIAHTVFFKHVHNSIWQTTELYPKHCSHLLWDTTILQEAKMISLCYADQRGESFMFPDPHYQLGVIALKWYYLDYFEYQPDTQRWRIIAWNFRRWAKQFKWSSLLTHHFPGQQCFLLPTIESENRTKPKTKKNPSLSGSNRLYLWVSSKTF